MNNTKVLVFSWEFPPRIIGGIARHVAELYPEIVKLDYEVHLITVDIDNVGQCEQVEGIYVHRIWVDGNDYFFDWIKNMNQSMYAYGKKLIETEGNFALIHGHDWLIADSVIPLKNKYNIPLITTIHATEYGRNHGIHNDIQSYISSQERKLVNESSRVVVCTKYMQNEVNQTLNCPIDKLNIIYNGIRAEKKIHKVDFNSIEFRRRFARDDEKIIYYVGRMTYEKGVQILIGAMPKILQATQNKTKLVIIGGGSTQNLQDLANYLDINQHCYFTGFMSDEDLNKFTTIADCAVFPSLYEPFGIVVLESFASLVPVVVSSAGGLPEVVIHEKTGIVTHTQNSDSLAWGILHVLNNPELAKNLINNAYQDLRNRFQWSKLAQETIDVYKSVLNQDDNIIE